MNPHQTSAKAYVDDGRLPFEVRNGALGFIILLDALNSWQLVRELKGAMGLPSAASFKHVSPAGAAVSVPLSDELARAYFADDLVLTPLAKAYARARGADRVASFGDWIALSEIVDQLTERLISRAVSDGVIAPGFDYEAIEILSKEQGGRYRMIEIDPNYFPWYEVTRTVFGIRLQQSRNNAVGWDQRLSSVMTINKTLPDSAKRDLTLAVITLKYTQSNSMCLALDGQVIGIGAGQQSRIQGARLVNGDNHSGPRCLK